MSSRIAEPSRGRKPWPSYFLVRTKGEIVPLVAVDELPVEFNLIDVPRTIDLEATKGMLNLGLQRSSGGYYQMKSAPIQARTVNIPTQPKVSHSRTAPTATSAPSPEPASSSSASGGDTETEDPPRPLPTIRGPSQTNQVRNAIPASYNNPQNSTPLCRHWCTHGICKWGQQCRYKHIMPMTLHGLQEVGLRDWPAWYRGLNPGYFVDSKDGGPGIGRGIGVRGSVRGVPRLRREENLKRAGESSRRSGGVKGEELGDEILRKLKHLEKEKERERERERERVAKSKAEHERERARKAILAEDNAFRAEKAAVVANTLRWEDDDSEAERVKMEKKKKMDGVEESRKLVDV